MAIYDGVTATSMPRVTRPSRFRFVRTVILTVALGHGARAQQTPIRYPAAAPPAPPRTTLSPGLYRVEGDDPGSGIHYVRILLLGTPMSHPSQSGSADPSAPDLSQPTLTGQCTRDRTGKLRFELFANFGGVPDPAFYPPWQPTPDDQFAPRTDKVVLTLEFLGYTRVKPFRREFERVQAPSPAQLRYLNPGRGSSNLEPPGWFFQYLRALPTLRLSDGTQSADFLTTPWLAQLHVEPVCAASGA